jgi:hypothetical protein
VFARRFHCPDDEPFIAWRGGVIEDFTWRPAEATFSPDAVPSLGCSACGGHRVEGVAAVSSDLVACADCGATLCVKVTAPQNHRLGAAPRND